MTHVEDRNFIQAFWMALRDLSARKEPETPRIIEVLEIEENSEQCTMSIEMDMDTESKMYQHGLELIMTDPEYRKYALEAACNAGLKEGIRRCEEDPEYAAKMLEQAEAERSED